MHVLHAHWHFPALPTENEGVLFWSENSEATLPPKKKGRRSKLAQPHPFCAASEATQQILSVFDPKVTDSQFNMTTLFLPTSKFGPHPSPQLVHDWDVDEDAPLTLVKWVVDGVWLSLVDAFYLLTALPDPKDLPPNLILGADVHYWQMVTSLVLETLAQQKLLPVLAQADLGGSNFHARWLPVLDGPQDGPSYGPVDGSNAALVPG